MGQLRCAQRTRLQARQIIPVGATDSWSDMQTREGNQEVKISSDSAREVNCPLLENVGIIFTFAAIK